ncbi:hypothetical protein EG329_001644 [Mollisiaceae sp. DMI_Dod_QoI]|nr:hypothetical protein EG329_001644 [Helotiales sp. DMI_Dod_QoI]
MAPKTLPPAAKQAKILEYFKESMGVFTLKELEKLLPSVASINQMQVKDYLQSLQDEYLIRVEKIGSGNWYWSFSSDAKKTKENIINNLKAEESKLQASIMEMERQVEEEMVKREDDEEMLEGAGMDRKVLLQTHDILLREMEGLDKELACYSDNDPAEILRKVEETKALKDSAIRWTDNIESLESFIVTRLSSDRAQVAQMMQLACGDEYILQSGLYSSASLAWDSSHWADAPLTFQTLNAPSGDGFGLFKRGANETVIRS